MFKIKVLISTIIFSFLLIGTSFVKNETREIEKNIYKLNKKIMGKEKDLNESELDFSYLTSPSMIEKRIEHIDNYKYLPIEYSKIFLSISNFIELNKKFAIQEIENEKKSRKDKNLNKNQVSFYFEDYLETNKKKKPQAYFYQDRIYLLFFLFFSLILIFSIRIIHVSLNKIEIFNQEKQSHKFTLLRRDIVDRNGELISRNIKSFHAAVSPKLVKNKENLILKLRLNFSDFPIKKR